jgi:methyl-accepting chemotaxis protein
MRSFRFLNTNIAVSVTLSVILSLLFFSIFVLWVFVEQNDVVDKNLSAFKEAKRQNTENLKLFEARNMLDRLISEANYGAELVMESCIEGTQSSSFRSWEDAVNHRWNTKITPLADSFHVVLESEIPAEYHGPAKQVLDDITRLGLLKDSIFSMQETYANKYKKYQAVKSEEEAFFLANPDENPAEYNLAKPPTKWHERGEFKKAVVEIQKTSGALIARAGEVFPVKKAELLVPDKFYKPFQDGVVWFVFGVVCLFIVLVIIVNLLINFLKKPLIKIEKYANELRNGNLPEENLAMTNEDYKSIARSLNYLNKKLESIKKFAVRVGQGQFDADDANYFEREGELGDSLVDLQNNLRRVALEDAQRNHINQGLANFSEILGNYTNDLGKFGDEVIKNLVNFLNANQGALFVVNDDDPDYPFLELVSAFAYEKKKYVDVQIQRGQGLVGQAWEEGQRIYMTDIPEGYVNITSGLGYSTPRCILIIPLIFNDECHGVIELASFKELQDYELGFVEKVSENISSALSSVKVNTKTQSLLSQSEELTKRMKVQEEEMMKNVAELRQTQDESQRREEEHLREIRRLKKRLEEYERNM